MIREARQEDIPALAELVLSFRDFLQSSDPTPEIVSASLEEVLADPRAVVLLAFEDDTGPAVGYLHMRVFTSFWTRGPEANIDDLYIAAEQRGHGLGEALLWAALERARERDVTLISLFSNERNERAQRFYLAHGFRVSGERRWGDGREIGLSRSL